MLLTSGDCLQAGGLHLCRARYGGRSCSSLNHGQYLGINGQLWAVKSLSDNSNITAQTKWYRPCTTPYGTAPSTSHRTSCIARTLQSFCFQSFCFQRPTCHTSPTDIICPRVRPLGPQTTYLLQGLSAA